MRKQRDPDKLQVYSTSTGVFISWLYDEGCSGTLMLSPEKALDFAVAVKAAAASMKP